MFYTRAVTLMPNGPWSVIPAVANAWLAMVLIDDLFMVFLFELIFIRIVNRVSVGLDD